MRVITTALFAGAVLVACSTQSPVATSSPSPIIFPSPAPSPSGSPVTRQVLPPAEVLPLTTLCSAPIQQYQDGNASPLFCRSGAVNVPAWKYYVALGPRVMARGRGATLGDVQAAVCADYNLSRATKPQETSAYELAAAYYSWSFATDPTQVMYGAPYCQ